VCVSIATLQKSRIQFVKTAVNIKLKTQLDPRHQKRRIRFSKLFEYSFKSDLPIDQDIKQIVDSKDILDTKIQQVAPEWPIARLNKVDLAILRLALWELLVEQKTPPKVIIDEAVEISKEYGSENTAKFVNGVLGTILDQQDKKSDNVTES